MIHVATYFKTAREIAQLVEKRSELSGAVSDVAAVKQSFVNEATEASELLQDLRKATFDGEPSFFSNKGRVLASFKKMSDSYNKFVEAVKSVGKIDAYLSVAKLYKEFEQHPTARFCFPEYVDQDTPAVSLTDFWHCGLDPDKVVTNSIDFGCNGAPRNGIVTGPNKGGKSTSLKAITTAVVFAQTFGIAPARSMTLTPFALISTYLNIADTVGKESLYEAEMMRTKKLLHDIQGLDKDELSFIIMDEMFTGTNAQEGMAGSYGVATKMGKLKRNITFLATHFQALTDLEDEMPEAYKNYKVSIEREGDKILFPYRVEHGIADQSIALDLLESEGFDQDIIDAAQHAFHNKQSSKMARDN